MVAIIEKTEEQDFAGYVRRGIALAGLVGPATITKFTGGMVPTYGISFNDDGHGGCSADVSVLQGEEEARQSLAKCLSVLPGWALSLADRVEALQKRLDEVAPIRRNLLGNGGCIRQDGHGGLWMLASVEKGWSAFGFRFKDWDDLFRRCNVRVGVVHKDDHGMYWPAEPMAVES